MSRHARQFASLLLPLAIGWCASPTWAAEPVACTVVDDVVYGHKDGLALTMDVVTPKENAKGLGIVLVSSGGWRSGKSDVPGEEQHRLEHEHWTQGLLRGGYTLFVARHGSGPRYHIGEMIDDMRRAVRFVRLRAADFHVDPARIGITSGSSGGHLSLMVAATGDDGNAESKDPVERQSSRVQAVVAWFPPTDLVNWSKPGGYKLIQALRPKMFEEMFGEVINIEEQLKSVSPIYFVTPDDAPLLLLHGDKDATVPLQQSEVLKAKYDEVGLPVKLIVEPGGTHRGWDGILDEYPAVWEWFDKYLQPSVAAAPAGQ